jgi:hypothetical protein
LDNGSTAILLATNGVLIAGGVEVIGPTICSFAVWKNDPDKTAPARTRPGEPRPWV